MIEQLERRMCLTALSIPGIASNTIWVEFADGTNGAITDYTPHRSTSSSYFYSDDAAPIAIINVFLTTDSGGTRIDYQRGSLSDRICYVNSDYTTTDNSSCPINLRGGIIDGHALDNHWPDLSIRAIYLHNTDPAFVKATILAGRSGGTYLGPGLQSSAAESFNFNAGQEDWVIGWAVNSNLPLGQYSVFAGHSVVGSDILIRFTTNGDADLDGKCGDNDVTIIGGFYDNGVRTNLNWCNADFNYDGKCDDFDVSLIAGYYGHSV
jgi:hypothetical protein